MRPIHPPHRGAAARRLALAMLLSGMTTSSHAVDQVIDLSRLCELHPGFRIDGAHEGDDSGRSVSGAGDVNGDGLADLIVGAPWANPGGDSATGLSYVVFGKPDGVTVDLADVTTGVGGFRIDGISRNDSAGRSVSGAGDVNGDGLADLIVGAPYADPGGVHHAGESYVVFGKADGAAVDLAAVATGVGGFRIDGVFKYDTSGISVSGAGDVNGDGLADLMVACVEGGTNKYASRGVGYVVFGKADGTPVDLAALDAGGFRIEGFPTRSSLCWSASGAGDVDGDGLADLIIGVPYADLDSSFDNYTNEGKSYVVFGKTDGAPVELAAVGEGTGGFSIDGMNKHDTSGFAVCGAGDVNGDGLADLIVGARKADPADDAEAGESYVVFGKRDGMAVDLAAVATGAGGFRIEGVGKGDYSGSSVSGAGDVNADGFGDLIVGAYRADPAGGREAGASYVVFGKADGASVDLAALGAGGFRIDGMDLGDYSGFSVSGAGDVNGDGLADVVVGARKADPKGYSGAGESYVIFSPSIAPLSAAYLGTAPAGDAPRMAVGVTGDGSNDSTPDGRCWIDFDDGAAPSTQVVALTRSDSVLSGIDTDLTANVAWHVATDRTAWNNAAVTFKYTDTETATLAESSIKLYTAESLSGPWTELPATLDTARNLVSGSVPTFNQGEACFVIAGSAATATPTPVFPACPPHFDEQIIDVSQLGTIHHGFVIEGIDSRANTGYSDGPDSSGFSVSGAGDVNGDGLSDVIVGAPGADPEGHRWDAGESYVVFGRADDSPVDLATLGSGGFRIDGRDAMGRSGSSVSGAGDVNGDGLDDLIVGVPMGAGGGYVIFGKADGAAVDLERVAEGTGGFRILSVAPWTSTGRSVSGAGDVNGDGLADLIVGARYADTAGKSAAGESYVIFGKTDGKVVYLANLGSGGFRIPGLVGSDFSGYCVSGAGDVNGDGLGDLIVGAKGATPAREWDSGESYVVFGKRDGNTVDLGALGTGGFRILGIDKNDSSGTGVSGAGDVNGDGLADLIVGAPRAAGGGNYSSGESYVVFGKADSTPVELETLGTGGFRLDGIEPGDGSGKSVSGAGDVNGDGLADLIVGAADASALDAAASGESYLVFGKASSTWVDLKRLGSGGFRIYGVNPFDRSGQSVSGAGDVNGDGLADLIVGAPSADPGGDREAGESYVIFSPSIAPPSATCRGTAPAGDSPRTAVGITGDGSNDSTPDSRCWLDFDAGAAPSTQTVVLTRSNSGLSGIDKELTANVMWQVTTDRTAWNSATVTFKYTDAEIDGLSEGTLVIHQASSPAGPWTPLTTIVDNSRNGASAQVTSLSYFALLGRDVVPTLLGIRSRLSADDHNDDGLVDAADVIAP